MTEGRDSKWREIISCSRDLDKKAENTDQYVCYMTDALVLSLASAYTDDVNEKLKMSDIDDIKSLIDKLGAYFIKKGGTGFTIKYTYEYKRIKKLIKEIESDAKGRDAKETENNVPYERIMGSES